MAISIVQQKVCDGCALNTVTFDDPVTPGNLIVAVQALKPSTGELTGSMQGTGWTTIAEGYQTEYAGRLALIQAKVAPDAGQSFTHAIAGGNSGFKLVIYELSGATLANYSILEVDDGARTISPDAGDFVDPASGSLALLVITVNAENQTFTPTSAHTGWTADYEGPIAGTKGPIWGFIYSATPSATIAATTTLATTPNDTGGDVDGEFSAAAVLFTEAAAEDDVVADFTGTPVAGTAPLTVDFTDASTGSPDTWDWDFGDGVGTSTDQNPSYEYTEVGHYSVTLTVTRSSDMSTDEITKTFFVFVSEPGVFIDWDGDGFGVGDYDDVSNYVMSWEIHRGAGPEVTSGSQPGSAVLILKNPSDLFNPYYESGALYGLLRDGVKVWIGPNSDGTLTGDDPRGLFAGRITDITPIPAGGASDSPKVEIVCEDMLGWARRTPCRLAFSEGTQHDAFRAGVLEAAGEFSYDLAHEIHTMPLANADTDLLSVLDAINRANGTRHFAQASDDYETWFTYTTRNRFYGLDGTSLDSLDAGSDHVTATDGWRLSADTVTNRQKATVTPITFTPAEFTVWQADVLPFNITPARPYSRVVEYDDTVRDSSLNIAYTGSAITETFTRYASGALIELTVASGTAAVTGLSVQGRLVRRLPNESHEANDTPSQAGPRGIREGAEIQSPYLGVIATARGTAEHIVWRYGNPQLRPTLTVVNWLPEQFDRELYDVIDFTSTQLKMSARLFEIVGITHTGTAAATGGPISHTTEYVLQESRVQSDPGWFILDSSLLDGSDVLHY